MGHLGYGESSINQEIAFSKDLKELREILNEVRTIIERKDNKKTQCWSLVFAAIAAVGTLIAIGLTIYYSK